MPKIILFLLISVAMLSAMLVGFAMATRKKRSLAHMILFALIISVSIYTILDMDYPRRGFIRLDAADRILHQLRDTMK
jgi:L-cystine uptake protein TcyP (sodium:dicarboxylate symporter family)